MQDEEQEGPHRGKGPAALSDEEIKEQLEESLTADSWLDASKMEVEVDEGIVTLRGQAASRQSKRRAEMWADHFMGVRDVRNLLEIENL
jgi:osmotically-inducible protein OsmY